MEPIYLDHAASTPVREEVREAMLPYMGEVFGNPSSVHAWGRKAATALEESRTRIGEALGVDRNDLYFVRGGTESDNLAVFGRAGLARAAGRAPVLCVSAVEHKAVLGAAESAVEPDGRLFVLPVHPDGTVDENVLDEAIAAGADLISVMWVNNEVGLRLPIESIAARADAAGVCVHTDAVQAVGKVPVALGEHPIHMATLTGHKIYGPKSTGLLYKRRGTELDPCVVGGGQERGLRPGTQDVAGAVGLATALELILEEREAEAARLRSLRDALWTLLSEGISDLRRHGDEAACAPHILNVGIPGLDKQALLIELDIAGVGASGGSACSSGGGTGSHVIGALYPEGTDGPSLRFSLGKLNDLDNVREAGRRVVEAVNRIRSYAGAS